MKLDPAGRADIGLDGVMRSLSGEGIVLDIYKLNATELTEAIDWLATWMPEKKELLLATLQGVDGTFVTDEEQLYDASTPLLSKILQGDTSPVEARSIFERCEGCAPPECGHGYCVTHLECILRNCNSCLLLVCIG